MSSGRGEIPHRQ